MKLLVFGLCGQSVFLRVPHFHAPGETLHASELFSEPGGKGYNQAVAAARMEAEVVFAGAVGKDADGDLCEERLTREGIASRLIRKPGRTAYASILTDDTGENRVTVYPGVYLTAEDVGGLEDEFRSAGLLLLTPEISEEAFSEAVRLARKHGVPIVLNPAPFFPWVTPYLRDAWLLTPNRSEACALLSCSPDDLEDRIASSGFPRMIVTLGADGALCFENGKFTHIPAPSVRAVDTTGAGDCLNGVLCALLLEGMALPDATKWAVRAASLSVTHAHVLDGMPRRQKKAFGGNGGVYPPE